MNNYIEHFQFVVSDLDQSVRFYTHVFGWVVRGRGREIAADRVYDWVHVGTDTSYIALRTPYNGEPFDEDMRGYKGNHIGIVTDDLDRLLNRIQELGRPVRRTADHPYRIRCYVRDYDDNEIEIIHYLTNTMSERNDYSDCARPDNPNTSR